MSITATAALLPELADDMAPAANGALASTRAAQARGRARTHPLATLHRDLKAVAERDPAARSALEVGLLYSGLHALWAHRVAHWLWKKDQRFVARALSQASRLVTGIEIHPGATLGPGLFIDHGMGVVIGETAEVGADVTIYHGVTLGGTSTERTKRHPTIGDRVTIGAGAKVLGAIEIGAGARIGANSVVVRPVPANSVVVGVPGQIISRRERPVNRPDLEQTALPDVVGTNLAQLIERMERLETAVTGHVQGNASHRSASGVWESVDWENPDYSI